MTVGGYVISQIISMMAGFIVGWKVSQRLNSK